MVVMELFRILIVVVFAQLHTFARSLNYTVKTDKLYSV